MLGEDFLLVWQFFASFAGKFKWVLIEFKLIINLNQIDFSKFSNLSNMIISFNFFLSLDNRSNLPDYHSIAFSQQNCRFWGNQLGLIHESESNQTSITCSHKFNWVFGILWHFHDSYRLSNNTNVCDRSITATDCGSMLKDHDISLEFPYGFRVCG